LEDARSKALARTLRLGKKNLKKKREITLEGRPLKSPCEDVAPEKKI
jgi:hypothetical protein